MWLLGVRYVALAVAALVTLLAGRQAISVSRADDPVLVSMVNNAYTPDTITISAGTTVVWENDEDPNGTDVVHDVIADDYTTFNSADIHPGETFTVTFSTPGTYTYFCALHGLMQGTVVVQ